MSELASVTHCFNSPSAVELIAELKKQQPENTEEEGYFVYHLDALKAHLDKLQCCSRYIFD